MRYRILILAAILLLLCACAAQDNPALPVEPSASIDADIPTAPAQVEDAPINSAPDLSYRLSLETAEIISEWKGYLVNYFQENHAPMLQTKTYSYSPYGLVVTTSENFGELEDYTADNGTRGMPEFLVSQDTNNRSFLFSISVYGFELPDSITSASVVVGKSEVEFSNMMVEQRYSAGLGAYEGTYISISLSGEHGNIAKDKADQLQTAFEESQDCQIIYHGSSGTDYTVTLSNLQVENLRHVLNAFSELLTYYYQ